MGLTMTEHIDHPMSPVPDAHYVVSFSGGKDSVASWLYLTREKKFQNVTCVFADTGHESSKFHDQWSERFEKCPCLNCYLDLLEAEHGLHLIRVQPILSDVYGELKPEKIRERLDIPDSVSDEEMWQLPLDMERLSIIKKRFPSSTVRFCTTHLKLRPMARWQSENCPGPTIRVSGVRAQESQARADRPTWIDNDDMFKCPLWLPIHSLTHEQVFALHAKHGVPVNPLYMLGMGRVGCWPCINCSKPELEAINRVFPETFVELGGMENRAADAVGKPKMSFFANDKTPHKYRSNLCRNSGKHFPDAEDVRRWAAGEPPKHDVLPMAFEEDWTEDVYQCVSQYGLCE